LDLTIPTGEGTVAITTVTVDDSGTSLNCEGDIEKYGKVFVTLHLTASDAEREAGELEGNARTITDDGTMIAATLAGSWRRDKQQLKVFFVDNCSNGDQNFVTWDIDIANKSAAIKFYSTF
jgi:hypothetical protein